MLPPTRASKGGRGLSFSLLSCRRDCLRPPTGDQSEAIVKQKNKKKKRTHSITSLIDNNLCDAAFFGGCVWCEQEKSGTRVMMQPATYLQASPRNLRPRPRTPQSTPTDCLKDHPAILSHISKRKYIAFAFWWWPPEGAMALQITTDHYRPLQYRWACTLYQCCPVDGEVRADSYRRRSL